MTVETLLHSINNNYAPLTLACAEELAANVSFRELKKGDPLVKEGQYADKTYFIAKGCARAYYLKDGKDISDWFAFETEFISPIISFFTHQPSPHYIEVLEDTQVLEISRDTIETLSKKYHEFEHLIRIVVTKTMLGQRERISSILFHSAEERYDQILTMYPDILNRVSLTHIASYLGMTLETLSRVRNSKTRI